MQLLDTMSGALHLGAARREPALEAPTDSLFAHVVDAHDLLHSGADRVVLVTNVIILIPFLIVALLNQ